MNIIEQLIEEALIRPLTTNVSFQDIESVDRRNFGFGDAQSIDDLEDDFYQKGFIGQSVEDDDGRIVGYVYGYSLAKEEYGEIKHLNIDDMTFYDDTYRTIFKRKKIKRTFTPKNSIYVANFAVNKEYRLHVSKLIYEFFRDLKSKGITYIFFEAMEDTQSLMYKNGEVNQSRVNTYGAIPLVAVDEGYKKLILLKLF